MMMGIVGTFAVGRGVILGYGTLLKGVEFGEEV